MTDIDRTREPPVDLAGLEAAVLSNQARDVTTAARPVDAPARTASSDIAQAIEQLDGELPTSVNRMRTMIEQNFGATANAMLNNAQVLRRHADLLEQAANELVARGNEASMVLRDAVAYERRASAMNAASSLLGERVKPEQP